MIIVILKNNFLNYALKDTPETTNENSYDSTEYDALTDRQKNSDWWPNFANASYDSYHNITPEERKRINDLVAEHRRRNQ
jgi:hypothetical protein